MDNIIGHSNVLKKLNNIVQSENIGHAYLFYGIDGIGKFLVAKEFAKAILCLNSVNGKACNNCDSCHTFYNSSDMIIVEPDSGQIKVDMIRALSSEIMLKPTISSRKVVVINDADLMNDSAQNALLKILEEPPLYATIILVASNKEKFLKTILSRVTEVHFMPLSDEEIKMVFPQEPIKVELLSYSCGSAGKYQKLANSEYIDSVLSFQKIFESTDLLEINSIMTAIKKDKAVKENILDILDLLIIKYGNDLKDNSVQKIKYIDILENVSNNLKRNANYDIQLDYLALQVWEANK